MVNATTTHAVPAEEVTTTSSAIAANEDLFDTLKQATKTAQHGARDVARLASAEWWLSLRAITLVLLSLTGLAMLLVLLWISVIGGIAYWAYVSDIHPLAIWLGLIATHVALVTWLWQQVRQLLRLVGFSQTVKAIVSPILGDSGPENVNESA